MFFSLISEMRHPRQAMRAAYVLQGFSTILYLVFAVVTYVYISPDVASPSLLSLPPRWAKAAFGVALLNFLVAGALYTHTAAKLVFVRLFRGRRAARHLHEHTAVGWAAWLLLVLLANGAAFVLAVGVPVFNYVVGLGASLFASWYTYGIAGLFWLHDAHHDRGLSVASRARWTASSASQGALAVATVLAGPFICVGGLFVTVKGIVDAYDSGAITEPFSC